VHCAEVTEHLTDVRSFAQALAAVLRPGKLLFLTTPHAGHFRRPRNLSDWPEVKPPEHLFWFTRASLRRLMEDSGLHVERFFFNLNPGLRMVARRV
jgi:2-polyprenyl-3-methyl-5-hydroxy-6-metoxy-1,4-benzoquinol methylase